MYLSGNVFWCCIEQHCYVLFTICVDVLILLFHSGHASMYGNGHFKSFDGKYFHFPGRCAYIFTQALDGSFGVLLDRRPWNYQVIGVVYKKNKITLTRIYRRDFHATVNGKKVKIPFTSESGFKIDLVYNSYVKVEGKNGFHLLWDGATQINVKVPSSYRNEVAGLAGNFNSKTIDDFLTPSEDLSHSAIDFGNSWMLPDNNCSKVSIDYKMTACESNHQVGRYAEEKCKILLSSTFEKCHRFEDPQDYYENCKDDVCVCNGRPECLCAVLAAYSRVCALGSKVVEGWRNVSGCGMYQSVILLCQFPKSEAE